MIRTMSIVVFLFAQTGVAAVAATCAGANPAITKVAVQSVTSDGKLNNYHIVGTVANFGSQTQPSNTLQFVDIWQYGVRLDAKSIRPLAPGQSATFSYLWRRSTDAARGTSTLNFRIRMEQGSDCNPANGSYNLTL
jgi:subtilase family serine protease